MAARQVATTATLEQLRTTFNTLSATDFGDISQLSSSISASNLVAAMNELEAEVAGFSVTTITAQTDLGGAPESTDTFVINDGGALKEMTVGNLFTSPSIATPTLTGNTTMTGNIIFEGATANSFETTLAITDPTADRTITFPNLTGTVSLITATETLTNKTLTSPAINSPTIIFEGSTADSFETTIAVTDPTADRTITLPNNSGTVALQNASIDMNGTELILDADADTSTTADTDDTIHIKIAGDDDITITTGLIEIKNSGAQSAIRLYCESSNAHYTALQSAAHSAYSGNVTVTLPATTDTLVGRTTTDTLTNKTLTSPNVGTALVLIEDAVITFEGASNNSFETTLTVTDPTADRTVTLPNETFKVASYANKATLDGNGSATTLTVGSGYSVNQFQVTINGVRQEPTEDFTYSGTTITLDAAPASGDRVVAIY